MPDKKCNTPERKKRKPRQEIAQGWEKNNRKGVVI